MSEMCCINEIILIAMIIVPYDVFASNIVRQYCREMTDNLMPVAKAPSMRTEKSDQ